MKYILIIDAYGIIFRCFHALPPLTNPEGIEVGALYGFMKIMMSLRKDFADATHLVVALDSGGKNFRHDIYHEYKANRPEAPENLLHQFALVREAITCMNISQIEAPGFEADDIIASVVKIAKEQKIKCSIISSDKDLMQLVDDSSQISIYDHMKKKIIKDIDVKEKFGVMPVQVSDLLALTGDSSDNIPGAKGIGNKTAAELLEQFGSLDRILSDYHLIKQNKRRQNIEESIESIEISRRLVYLDNNLSNFDIEDLCKKEIDENILYNFLARHGFKSLIPANKLVWTYPRTSLFLVT